MEDKKVTNGTCDEGGFNWATGAETSQYIQPAALPTGGEVDAEKYFSKPTDDTTEIRSVERLGTVDVRAPKKQDWFRCHPEMFVEVYVVKKESSGDFYLIDRAIVSEVTDARAAYLSACITNEGARFLWPILKPKGDGAGHQLHDNALADLSLARTTWIRRQWDAGSRSHKVDAAQTTKEPSWPSGPTMNDWVTKGFKGRFIDDLQHPFLCQLRGEL